MVIFCLHLAAVVALGSLAVRLLLGPAAGSGLSGLALGWGTGAGMASILGLLSLLLTHTWSRWLLPAEVLLLLILYCWRADESPTTQPPGRRSSRWHLPLAGAAAALLTSAILLFVLITMAQPHGRWDSWAIWNMRARFLFRSPADWPTIFNPSVPHADYPLLVPLNVALGWVMAHGETVLVPAAIAMAFTFAPAALLAGYFQDRNLADRGIIAALCLIGTPFFLFTGVDQVADIPLSLYFLATIVLLLLSDQAAAGTGRHRFLLLAGLMAGMAAWTKNEGLLFILVVFFSRLLVPGQGLRAYLRSMAWFAAGLLPVAGVLAWFKLGLAPANDLWASRSLSEIVAKLTDIRRYLQVLEAYGSVAYGFRYQPTVSLNMLLLAYALWVDFQWHRLANELRWLLSLLLLMLAGYFTVFILTPHDLAWHLHTALNRLVVQLYPAALLLYFLLLPDPSAVTRHRHLAFARSRQVSIGGL